MVGVPPTPTFGGQERRNSLKKFVIAFIVLMCLGFYINAQNWQSSIYNDGKLLVFIEKKNVEKINDPNARQRFWKSVRVDELILENISTNEITVKYSFRCISRDFNDNFVEEKIIYRDRTLSSGGKIRENANYFLKSGRFSFVDSFVVMNVSVKGGSTSSDTYRPSQPQQPFATVPQWAQGSWGGSGGIRITSTNYFVQSMNINFPCVKVLGNTVHFEGIAYTEDTSIYLYIVISKTDNPNSIKTEMYVDNESEPKLSQISMRYSGR